MALRALETTNSSVDAHAINDNFVVLSNRRKAKIKVKKMINGSEVEVEEEIETWTVDVFHFITDTMEKGKQNDHAMHHACLDYIMKLYQDRFENDTNLPSLRRVIVWTDNAPTQYRCRQNFIKIASVCARHNGLQLIHDLLQLTTSKVYGILTAKILCSLYSVR